MHLLSFLLVKPKHTYPRTWSLRVEISAVTPTLVSGVSLWVCRSEVSSSVFLNFSQPHVLETEPDLLTS